MKPNFTKLMPVLALNLAAHSAFAGNITDINVSVLPDQQRVIKVKFDKGVVEPTGFITANPARIALDFAGTDVRLSQNSLTFNDTLLSQINAAQGNGRTRVLLSLGREAQYSTQVKGDEVWIYVSEASSQNAPARNDSNVIAQAGGTDFALDFKRGSNRSGVIEFRSGYDNEPKVKVQSDRLILTLKNYPLTTQDQKNIDVTDFGTPVRTVTVRRIGNDAQITIRAQGTWGHKLTPHAAGGRYTVTISPEVNTVEAAIKKATNPVKPKKVFTGKHISLDFQDISVRTALQILAKESGMNIVASDKVQGQLTLALKDVPWDQALDLILEARDLVQERNGNIINIMPRKDQEDIEKSKLKALVDTEDMRPLISQTFQLKYKNVEELRDVLKLQENSSNTKDSRNILTNRGSALIDPATNTLIVNDVAAVIQKFQKLIEELDVPARQVMVEARIVEAEESVGRNLGVKFGYARAGRTGWGSSMDNARINRNVGVGADTSSGIQLSPNINLPSAATTTAIGLVRSIGSSALGLELQASETDNRSKTIATPRVLTQDRKAAEIKQGTQIPYQTREADGTYETNFKDAVLSLKVTPRITPDNNIILDVVINKDDVDDVNSNADGEPAIKTRQVTTQAMVENGGTLVVGGVYQETVTKVVSKVPLLGDVPVLGNLFKSNGRRHSRNELLFFITPRIIEGQNSVMRY